MGRAFDDSKLRGLLEAEFANALAEFRANRAQPGSHLLRKVVPELFASRSQSFREALVGISLVRICDQSANLRFPSVKQGPEAYPGRDIDERVVNPFLQQEQIPCSKGPYLAVFRRDFKFLPDKAAGVRDKAGYDAFLKFISLLEKADTKTAKEALRALLHGFLVLREESSVELRRVQRLSLDQFYRLTTALLAHQSGGLIPVLLSVAMSQSLSERFNLGWQVESQGINAADKASGASGDITVKSDNQVILAVEVTERPIERNRVVATFNTKIVKQGVADYLFYLQERGPKAMR